ncbi:MAG: hypothetical protein IPM25_08575 [Chloracidobacterium sp.]|nr:hypothetical protein [Chloracidobacterium sp.]
MSRLYACVISPDAAERGDALLSVAGQFSYSIRTLEDGVVFDVSGLERLIGKPAVIAKKVEEELAKQTLRGSVAVAETAAAAALLAREGGGNAVEEADRFAQLPLSGLPIDADTLGVFGELGLHDIEALLRVPRDELIARYGREFEQVIKSIRQEDRRPLTPNIRENRVSWSHNLDFPVEDFEQLIFLINHGLEGLFGRTAHSGFSTEHIDIAFRLSDRTRKAYEIKASFPTLDRSFWLKLINLRISFDPPQDGILALKVTAHFTKPRTSQRGLYAVSRPEPESLLLTVGKLKKLAGDENVGVPVMLNERLSEPFKLDAGALPEGRESSREQTERPVIAFSYFRPPLSAEVLVREGRLVYIRTRLFSGHVTEYSGVWKADSKWWEQGWKTREWDVEMEGGGIYRLGKIGAEWFLIGEYD